MKSIKFNWHCLQKGRSNSPAILFLHGFMGAGNDWNFVIERLFSNYYCFAPDLPGHGQTETTDNSQYSIATVASQLIALLNEYHISRTNLVGYSMGGRLALYLMVHYPDRINRIIIESASPGLKTPKERRERRQEDDKKATLLETGNFEDFLKKWYDQPLFTSIRSLPQFDSIFKTRMKNNPDFLAKSLRYLGTGQQPSLWSILPKIGKSVHLFVGEKDQKYCNIAFEMQKKNPNFRITMFKGCGHNIHLENPENYISKLEECLIQ